jgi:hypothetical protein
MLDRWKPRLGGKPVSAADLAAQAREIEAEIAQLSQEQTVIDEALPSLMAEAERQAEAIVRLAEIDALLPLKSRALNLLKAAIPAAEKRETIEKFEAQKAELEKRTEKLARTLPDQYVRAAEQFVTVLRAMEANAHEWAMLTAQADIAGLRVHGEDAEYRLRRGLPGYERGGPLWRGTSVPAWHRNNDLYPDPPKEMGM